MSDNLKFDESSNTLTINHVEGVDYLINGRVVTGDIKLTKNTTVRARPAAGRTFPKGTKTEWRFKVSGSSDASESDSAQPAEPVETSVSGGSPFSGLGTTPNPGPTGSEGSTGGTP